MEPQLENALKSCSEGVRSSYLNHMNLFLGLLLKNKNFEKKVFFFDFGHFEIFFVELSSEKRKNRPRGTLWPLSGAQMTVQRQKHQKSRDLVVPRTPVLSVPKNIAGEKKIPNVKKIQPRTAKK